eukprot:1535058-Pleurochrysis_carterae.AAC.3
MEVTLYIKGNANIIRGEVSWIPIYIAVGLKQACDRSPAAAQRRCLAASAAVFAVVRCRTQLAEPRLCTSRHFLVLTIFGSVKFVSGIPDGCGTGALVTHTLSRSQGWSSSSPEPDRVRGVFGDQYLLFTHYNPTEGGRSTSGPGRGHYPR